MLISLAMLGYCRLSYAGGDAGEVLFSAYKKVC